MPAATPPLHSDLYSELLGSVSRSFYLTLRLLPGDLRQPVSLAYLLARATDTLADSPAVELKQKLEDLRAFADAIQSTQTEAPILEKIRMETAPLQPHPGEKELLHRLHELLSDLEKSPDADRIRGVLHTIASGQVLDLERFGNATSLTALETDQDLDDYTFRVAGCVGEFWTRICAAHLPTYGRRDSDTMIEEGIRFGKGLQLVNILRDFPGDLSMGRCYLPVESLERHGLQASQLRGEPLRAAPVLQEWIAVARSHLGAALEYTCSVNPFRIRLACALPLILAVRTLDLLQCDMAAGRLTAPKVGRGLVYRLLASLALTGAPRWLIRRWHGGLPSPKDLS